MTKEFSAPDATYHFDSHSQGHYGPALVAVNVKYHGYPKLDEEYTAKLKEIAEFNHGDRENTLRDYAWQDTSENWWEWAQDQATQAGLGKVWATGRQGGWLVLQDWSISRVEELLDYHETRCTHCDAFEEDHVDDACLFMATKWAPAQKLDKSHKESLDTLAKYVETVQESMKSVGDDLLENLKYLIDEEYSAMQAEKRTMRKPWPEYFMDIARAVSTRATCDRKHVGAVIVHDNRILCTGYNGSIPGAPHCDDEGHMMEDGHCVRTVHAEANAINQAARHGIRIEGATIYTTASPCWPCFQKIVSAGLKRIVFGELYRDTRIHDFAQKAGIELVDMSVKKEEQPSG